MNFLKDNNISNEKQFGFMSGSFAHVTNDIYEGLDNNSSNFFEFGQGF